MRSLRHLSALAAAGLLGIGLAAASPASAGELTLAEAGSAAFPQRAYSLHTSKQVALDQSDVTLSENGDAVDDFELASAAEAARNSFATILVIDASDSMRGQPIQEAMRAARAFAEHRAPRQQLGVVTFSGRPKVLLQPTTDEDAIDAALANTPALEHSTHLYDGIDEALGLLTAAGVKAGTLVVLSDGADTGSSTTLDAATAHAKAAGVRIFTVGLRSHGFDPGALKHLAAGGTFADAARPDQLAVIFKRFSAQLASEYLLTYESAAAAGGPVTVAVGIDGVGTAEARYRVPASAAAGESPQNRGVWASSATMVGVIALAAGLFGIALFLLVRPRQETARERLARFLSHRPQSRAAAIQQDDERPGSRGLLDRVERSFDGRDWWTRFNEELDVAGVEMPAIRILALTFAGTVAAAVVIGQLMGVPILVPLALLVPLGVRISLNRRLRTRREEFSDQLADNLQLVASSLRAGQSMAGALALVTEESPEPARGEFRRIVNDERLGVPLEEAIRAVASRMDSRDMQQLALVATIQRETGGNSAEVIEQLISTIRERTALRRLMNTLTAQGRLTQIVVSALPVVLLLVISVIQPDYMKPLFETSGGHIALGLAAFLSVTGSLLIKRIVALQG